MQGEETELRAFSNGQYYGRFMMTPDPDARPPLQARLTAVTLAGLAGAGARGQAALSDTLMSGQKTPAWIRR